MCDLPLSLRPLMNNSHLLNAKNFFISPVPTLSNGVIDSAKAYAVPVTTDFKVTKIMITFEKELLELIRKLLTELTEDNLDEMIEAIRNLAVHVNDRKQYYLNFYSTNIELSIINLLRYIRTSFNEGSVETTLTQINEFNEKRESRERFGEAMEFGSNIYSYTIDVRDGKYYSNNTVQPLFELKVGNTYVFDWYYNIEHPLYFSTTSDGIHNGGTQYETGVEIGLNNSKLLVTEDTPKTLYYYCINHPNMGGEINVIESDCGCGGAGTRSLGGRKKNPCNC